MEGLANSLKNGVRMLWLEYLVSKVFDFARLIKLAKHFFLSSLYNSLAIHLAVSLEQEN